MTFALTPYLGAVEYWFVGPAPVGSPPNSRITVSTVLMLPWMLSILALMPIGAILVIIGVLQRLRATPGHHKLRAYWFAAIVVAALLFSIACVYPQPRTIWERFASMAIDD